VREEELRRVQEAAAAKDAQLESLSARLQQALAQLLAAQKEAGSHREQAQEQAEAVRVLGEVPVQLLATLQQVIRSIKERREATERAHDANCLRLNKEIAELREALAQADAALREAEDYSGQLEQRLEAALEWRNSVEAQVRQQSGHAAAIEGQLSVLKEALEMSPDATPSKGVAKVRCLKDQVAVALQRVQEEATTSEREREGRAQAEHDIGVLKEDLGKMQVELEKQQRQHELQRADMDSERAEAHQLRHVLETQIGMCSVSEQCEWADSVVWLSHCCL
jgi:hypothetical protein